VGEVAGARRAVKRLKEKTEVGTLSSADASISAVLEF
jgi:hypothetical protein